MINIVFDASALIPSGDKPEKEKDAIIKLGNKIIDTDATIYLSKHLIKLYQNKVKSKLKEHHPLPEFQKRLIRVLPALCEIVAISRNSLCKIKDIKETKLRYHILEKSRLDKHSAEDINLQGEDKNVLRTALAVEREVFLITVDTHFHNLRSNPTLNNIEIIYPSEFIDRFRI